MPTRTTGRAWLAANPFDRLERRNERADRKHIRRALTPKELGRLFDAARRRPLEEALRGNRGRGEAMGKKVANISPKTRDRLEWLGETRAMAYRVAAGAGLRWGELRSITLGATRLDDNPPHLLLLAKDEKNRKGAVIPLGEDLARALGTLSWNGVRGSWGNVARPWPSFRARWTGSACLTCP